MPAKAKPLSTDAAEQLAALGHRIRERRTALRVSATAAAEAAGISRVTLHRIEKAEASTTIGAWVNVLGALGLELNAAIPGDVNAQDAASPTDREGWIPTRVCLADYPQLKSIAWHVHGVETLTPLEAWSIYQRNWRHVDEGALTAGERHLIAALRAGLSDGASRV